MANPTYGSPNLDDATAKWDKTVNIVAERLKYLGRIVGPRILNRPMGSVPIEPEEQLADFEKARNNPAALQQIHAQRMQQMGKEQGTVDFIRWWNKNQKRTER